MGEVSVFAERAGISVLKEEQCEMVERLVDRVLPVSAISTGVTNLTEDHIEVQGAPSVKHRFRRMSPKMMEIAQQEVEKMRVSGVIERYSP